MKTIKEKDSVELKLDILEFALEHKLAIHPDKNLYQFCINTILVGHCICRNNELYCPCEEALLLCEREGHCRCRLFVTPEAYPQELLKSRERWRRKYGKSQSVCGESLSTVRGSEKAARKRAFQHQRNRGPGGPD